VVCGTSGPQYYGDIGDSLPLSLRQDKDGQALVVDANRFVCDIIMRVVYYRLFNKIILWEVTKKFDLFIVLKETA